MTRMSSRVSGWKWTMWSNRFRNSNRNVSASFRSTSRSMAASAAGVTKPSALPRYSSAPVLEVAMRIDDRHDTVSPAPILIRSEEHTSELQSLRHLVCRLLLEKKKKTQNIQHSHQ